MNNIEGKGAVLVKKKKLAFKDVLPYIYIAPFFIFAAVFLLSPFFTSIIKSFYRYDMLTVNEYVGFQNFINIFTNDPKFKISLINLVWLLCGFVVCFQFPVIAAKLTMSLRNSRTQYFFRSAFLLPMGIPGVVSILMWKFIYYPEVGVLSRIFDMLGATYPNFLGNPQYALLATIFMGFPWIGGMNYIIVYSALQGIDNALLEAADLDGAKYFTKFFKIELPIIMPQLRALAILGIIALVQDYERFLILTGGGPLNKTLVPGLHMYNMAFGSGEANFGYSCAISLVLFLMTLIFVILLLLNNRHEEDL